MRSSVELSGTILLGCHQVLLPLCVSPRPRRRRVGRMICCEWWIFVIISAVTLVLYALLLLSLYIMLSRKIAQHSRGMQGSSSPVAQPTPDPAPSAGGAGAQPTAPACAGSSDTSSDTSEDSADSPSCPQHQSSGKNINYTSLVFPGKGRGPGCAQDLKDIRTGTDYVNVDPKKKKTHLRPCFSPVASKPVEYSEVKL